MKLKKFIPLANDTKQVYVVEDPVNERIWLGNGNCFYPLYNIKEPTEDFILTLLDVPYDKRSKYTVRITQRLMLDINFDDAVGAEQYLRGGELNFTWRGLTFSPWWTQGGQGVMLQNKFFAPIDDTKGSYSLFLRQTPELNHYIAVKDGMFLKGIIYPLKIGPKFKDLLRDTAGVDWHY